MAPSSCLEFEGETTNEYPPEKSVETWKIDGEPIKPGFTKPGFLAAAAAAASKQPDVDSVDSVAGVVNCAAAAFAAY